MDAIYDNPNFLSVCEFLPNHLYFVTVQNINNGGSCEAVIPHTDDMHFFNTDTELLYHNFYGDFGPLNISCLYKFCKKLTNKLAAYAGDAFYEKFVNSRFGKKEIVEKLQEKFVKKKVVVYYTSTNNEKRANAAFLISSFALLYLGFSPRMAYKTLQPNKMRYRPFQDPSVGLSPYKINMKDCLDALHKASAFGFFNFYDFDVNECNYYENTEHGDMNWIIPQKFLAFPGPVEEKSDYYHHPNFFIEYFLSNNVTDVVRLNQRTYDAKCFTMFGIRHHDLYMQDGADPPESVLKSFMNVAETAMGAIAVHCKAGLGRTGTLIGAYLLKHYRMTPKEAIAWIRICRPGSVIGHQQTWLENHREILWYQGNEWRFKMYGKTEIVPFLPYGIYSFQSPKKEFVGLRELLVNLTKRSRYRFVVKNRTKSSKTKLQQMIKTILNSGKPTKSKSKEKKEKGSRMLVTTVSTSDALQSAMEHKTLSRPSTAQTSVISTRRKESCKNLHYLKPPPQPYGPVDNFPAGSESEYTTFYTPRNVQETRETSHKLDYQPQIQKPVDHYNPNLYSYTMPQDVKQSAMYSNPNSFSTNSNYPENEYPQISDRQYFSPRQDQLPGVPKSRSEKLTSHYDRSKMNMSKSIDKNWKQNTATVIAGNRCNSAYSEITDAPKNTQKENDNICAFDTRGGSLSQYSRFNRWYQGNGYPEQMQLECGGYHGSEMKGSRHGYRSMRSPHGFLLSPDDLQSWMETFDKKGDGETRDVKHDAKNIK